MRAGERMNKYIKTSYLYLISCIPFFVIYIKDFFDYFAEGKKKFLIWSIFYLALVGVCNYETEKERRRVRKIIANGKCIEGVVDRLQEIKRETFLIDGGIQRKRSPTGLWLKWKGNMMLSDIFIAMKFPVGRKIIFHPE